MTARVVMFSGGAGSWAAARRTVEAHGPDVVTLLFCDTLVEDPDLYRFLADAAADVGAPLVRIADGRTPWQVFRDERFLGNARIAPCSKLLKQRPARQWMTENAPSAVVVLGIDWTEAHRLPGARRGWEPWPVEAPLCERPFLSRHAVIGMMTERGIRPPDLYGQGFPHNNCAGGCVRAGAAQFARLYRQRPAVFAEWEQGEADLRAYLGADVAILRDRRNGETRPLTLAALRERLDGESTTTFDGDEWGGCGCFVDGES